MIGAAPPPAPVVAAPRTAQQASRSGVRTAPAADAPVRPNVSGGVLGIAASYTGIYYRYGGTTPAGFDCSGFVQFVFGQAGKSLPRTATAQAQATQRVSNPQPGDLVFFGKSAEKIAHVGMMISREEFIHATTHDRPIVQISRLSDPYWRKLFLGSRRPRSR